MKRTVFFAVLLFGFGSLAVSAGMANYDVLKFETANGEILTLEVVQEQPFNDNIPVLLRPVVENGTIDPEDHEYFQALVQELYRPEKEEPFPFERN